MLIISCKLVWMKTIQNLSGSTSSQKETKALNSQFKSVFTKKAMKDIPKLSGNKYPKIGQLTIDLYGVQQLLENINLTTLNLLLSCMQFSLSHCRKGSCLVSGAWQTFCLSSKRGVNTWRKTKVLCPSLA